jgi:hypothetical protein
MTPKRTFARQISIQACLLLCAVSAFSQTPKISRLAEGYHCSEGDKQLDVTAFSTNVLRISIRLQTERDARTPVLVPGLHETPAEGLAVRPTLSGGEIQTRALKAKFDCAAQTLDVTDNARREAARPIGPMDQRTTADAPDSSCRDGPDVWHDRNKPQRARRNA